MHWKTYSFLTSLCPSTGYQSETWTPQANVIWPTQSYEASIDGFVAAFRPSKYQSGAIFAIDGAIIGLDLFDHPSTFEKLFPKLLQSYALDALDSGLRPFTVPSLKIGADFVTETANDVEVLEFPAIGKGTDIRLTGRTLTGSALEANGTILHLSAFRIADDESRSRSA